MCIPKMNEAIPPTRGAAPRSARAVVPAAAPATTQPRSSQPSGAGQAGRGRGGRRGAGGNDQGAALVGRGGHDRGRGGHGGRGAGGNNQGDAQAGRGGRGRGRGGGRGRGEVIDQASRSPQLPYTHFVSIPLIRHSKLLDSVVRFQKSVLESASSSSGDSGIDRSIFVRPATFHLTLLMLKLWNEERVQAAADCLHKVMPLVHRALENSPLTIKLTGVDCFHGNPAQAHVLYAKVHPDDQELRLKEASRVIIEAFTEAGLVMDKDQMQTLTLHATLMNTAQRSGGGHGKRIPFNATEVVAKYQQYEWGTYHVAEAHLSQRFVYDDMNGYYRCCTSIPFP